MRREENKVTRFAIVLKCCRAALERMFKKEIILNI